MRPLERLSGEGLGGELKQQEHQIILDTLQECNGSRKEVADKLGIAEFNFFTITLAIQRETGGNLAETLSNLADVLRKRAQMKLKIRAMSSESKASAYIVGSLPFIWNLADVAMGLMAITNLVAILLLSGLAVKLARDYDAQRATGKLPTFDARKYPEIRSKLAPGIWD